MQMGVNIHDVARIFNLTRVLRPQRLNNPCPRRCIMSQILLQVHTARREEKEHQNHPDTHHWGSRS